MTPHPYGWKRGNRSRESASRRAKRGGSERSERKATTVASPERSEAGAPRPRSKAQEAKKNGPHPSGVRAGAPAVLLVGGRGLGVRSSGFVRGSGAGRSYSEASDSERL